MDNMKMRNLKPFEAFSMDQSHYYLTRVCQKKFLMVSYAFVISHSQIYFIKFDLLS